MKNCRHLQIRRSMVDTSHYCNGRQLGQLRNYSLSKQSYHNGSKRNKRTANVNIPCLKQVLFNKSLVDKGKEHSRKNNSSNEMGKWEKWERGIAKYIGNESRVATRCSFNCNQDIRNGSHRTHDFLPSIRCGRLGCNLGRQLCRHQSCCILGRYF